DAPDGGMVEEVPETRLHVTPRAVLADSPTLDRGSVPGDGACDGGRSARDVVGMDELEGAPSETLLGPVTRHSLDRGALVEDHPLGVDDRYDVGAPLDERAETVLVPAQRRLGRVALAPVPLQLIGDVDGDEERDPDARRHVRASSGERSVDGLEGERNGKQADCH